METTVGEVMSEARGGWRELVGRPLMLLLFMGCSVSFQASGRLSLRLIADGAVSFLFLPVFEMAALAVVFRRGPRPISFPRAVDLFFAGNTPWLAWLVALAALRSLMTPVQATAPSRVLLWSVAATMLVPIVWSVRLDYAFFRDVLLRPKEIAVRDLALERAIAWLGALTYFFGIAVWPEVIGRLP